MKVGVLIDTDLCSGYVIVKNRSKSNTSCIEHLFVDKNMVQ